MASEAAGNPTDGVPLLSTCVVNQRLQPTVASFAETSENLQLACPGADFLVITLPTAGARAEACKGEWPLHEALMML
jgi:hypothetical protein